MSLLFTSDTFIVSEIRLIRGDTTRSRYHTVYIQDVYKRCYQNLRCYVYINVWSKVLSSEYVADEGILQGMIFIEYLGCMYETLLDLTKLR